MKQMIHKIRIAIDSDIDINEINFASYKKITNLEASAYPVSTTDQETKGNKFKNKNNKRTYNYQNKGLPINMDSRGDLRYDWKGNPIDMTHQQPKRGKFDNSTQ